MKYVYLANIEDTNIYKIGFTKQVPEKRVKGLQTGNPYKIKLVNSYKSDIAPSIESVIHNFFKYKKNNPNEGINLLGEWFVLEKNDIESFGLMCENIEKNIKAIRDSTLYF
jgi:hypothetical protein